jgi:hypothetical protein
MLSDLISYGLLVSVFVVTGLRMFVEKPNGLKQLPLRSSKSINKNPNRHHATHKVPSRQVTA